MFYKKYLVLAAIMLTGVLGLNGCKNKETEASEWIKELTEVEVPSEAKILYHSIDKSFHNGRHSQYSVFEFKEEPIDFLSINNFNEGNDTVNEEYFEGYIKTLHIRYEDVPVEYHVNFNLDYLWIREKNAYFFYYPNDFMLIVFIPGL